MTERTFMIFKPECIEKGHVQDVIDLIFASGLFITDFKEIKATPELIKKHYAHIVDKPFYQAIENNMLKRPLYIAILVGDDAVFKWRELMGNTYPNLAKPNTIRGKFGYEQNGQIFNMVHGSDSAENAEREINLWYEVK